MNKPKESTFASSVKNYLMTLEPLARDVVLKNDVNKETQADGSTKLVMTPTRGDAYLPKEMAAVLSKSFSKSIFEHLVSYINDVVSDKLNELIDEYNTLRSDIISGGISTSAKQVDKIP